MQESILPKIVETNSPGYTCVEELKEILNYANIPEGAQIRNVALTGPFGSGKSSILLTVQKWNCSIDIYCCPIKIFSSR